MKRVHIIPCVFSICMLLILFSNSQVLAQQYARANQFKGFIDLYDPKRPENELPSRLSLKIKAEIEAQTQKNSDFKNAGGDSFKTVEPSLSFAFSYPPTENLTAYLTLETSALFYDDPREEKEDEAQVELEEVYLQYKNTGGDILVTLGRRKEKIREHGFLMRNSTPFHFAIFSPALHSIFR
ncbi:MAG: hypothetical protein ACE5FU_09480 [Nitrospinota bacterium]